MLFESQSAQKTASPNFNEIQPEYFHRSADNIINLFEWKSERQNFSKRASKGVETLLSYPFNLFFKWNTFLDN